MKAAGKRVLAGFLIAAGAALLFFLAVPLAHPAGSVPPQVNGRTAVHLQGDAPIFAGAARVPIEIPVGAPLAGYAGFRSASSPATLHARALALRAGTAQVVLVSLGHGSRTLAVTAKSGRFVVSILQRRQRGVAVDFAERGAPFPVQHVRRTHGGFLAVAGAAAVLGCRVVETRRAGDHDLVLGEVVEIQHGGGEPLVFYRGRFGGMQTDAFAPAGHPISLDEGAGW